MTSNRLFGIDDKHGASTGIAHDLDPALVHLSKFEWVRHIGAAVRCAGPVREENTWFVMTTATLNSSAICWGRGSLE